MARYDEILAMVKNVWNNLETVNFADSIDNYPKCKSALRYPQLDIRKEEYCNAHYIVEMTKALLADFPKAEVSPIVVAQYLKFCQNKKDFLPQNFGDIAEIFAKLSAKEKLAEADWSAYNLLLPFVMHEFIKEIRTIYYDPKNFIDRFWVVWNQVLEYSFDFLPEDIDIWKYSIQAINEDRARWDAREIFDVRYHWIQGGYGYDFQCLYNGEKIFRNGFYSKCFLSQSCAWASVWKIRFLEKLCSKTDDYIHQAMIDDNKNHTHLKTPVLTGIITAERLKNDLKERIANHINLFWDEDDADLVIQTSSEPFFLLKTILSNPFFPDWEQVHEFQLLSYLNIALDKLLIIPKQDNASILGMYNLVQNFLDDFDSPINKISAGVVTDTKAEREAVRQNLKETYPWIMPYIEYMGRLYAILKTPVGESVQHIIDTPSNDGTMYEFPTEILSLRFDPEYAQKCLDTAIINACSEIDETHQEAEWGIIEGILSKHLCPEFSCIVAPQIDFWSSQKEIINTEAGAIYPNIFGIKNTYWELFSQYRKHWDDFTSCKYKTYDDFFNLLDSLCWEGVTPVSQTHWGKWFKEKQKECREKLYPLIIKIAQKFANSEYPIENRQMLLEAVLKRCRKYDTFPESFCKEVVLGGDNEKKSPYQKLISDLLEISRKLYPDQDHELEVPIFPEEEELEFWNLLRTAETDLENKRLAEEKKRQEIEKIKQETEIQTRKQVLFELSHSIKNLVASVSEPLVLLREQLTGNQQRTVKNALAGAGLIRDLANGVHMSMRGEPGLWRKDVLDPGRNALTLEMILLEAVRHAVSNMFDGKYFTEFSRKYFNDIDIFYAARDEWENADTFEKVNLCLNKYFFDFKLDIQKGTLDIPVGDGEGTATKLLIMFQELLLNAVKYSSLIPKEKRFIHINAATTPEYWHFEFKNSASKEQQRKSFGIGTSVLDNFSKLFESEYSVKFENDFYQTNMVFTVKSKEA